jgi:hypothetical protein
MPRLLGERLGVVWLPDAWVLVRLSGSSEGVTVAERLWACRDQGDRQRVRPPFQPQEAQRFSASRYSSAAVASDRGSFRSGQNARVCAKDRQDLVLEEGCCHVVLGRSSSKQRTASEG